MPQALQPYLDLAHDTGLALTDAGFAYGLLINAAALLALAGLLLNAGLIATHGKSHGTRFSALSVFGFAGLAGAGAWLLMPAAEAAGQLPTLLAWSWVPPAAAALALLTTMAKNAKPRAAALALTTLLALAATVYGGMISVANARAFNPDSVAWLDGDPNAINAQAETEADAAETDAHAPKSFKPGVKPAADVIDTAAR